MRKGYSVAFRRKRLGKTDYRKRLRLLLANKPRLVVRKSINNIIAQIVEYDGKGDNITASAHASELKKYGWNGSRGNIPAAYLTGLLVGSKAKKKNIRELVLDIGLQTSVKGSRVYSLLKGCIDAGLSIPHSNDVLPPDDRIMGKHIAKFDSGKFEEAKKKISGA